MGVIAAADNAKVSRIEGRCNGLVVRRDAAGRKARIGTAIAFTRAGASAASWHRLGLTIRPNGVNLRWVGPIINPQSLLFPYLTLLFPHSLIGLSVIRVPSPPSICPSLACC